MVPVIDELNAKGVPCSLNGETKQQNANKRMGNALNNIWAENKNKFKEWLLHKKYLNLQKEII